MFTKIKLDPHLCRRVTFFGKDSAEVPEALYEAENIVPNVSFIDLPLPCRKDAYNCSCRGGDGALWLGSSNGVTRYDASGKNYREKVMYFAGSRYLKDNHVISIIPSDKGVWVNTKSGISLLEMVEFTCEQKAAVLLEETRKYVDRHGMVTQKGLAIPDDVTSALNYGSSDNDGCFTAAFAIGEMFRYAVMLREKGSDAPETKDALAGATRAVEACLLLTYIHCRGNGFVSRSYELPYEPVPDDGFFFRINNGKATCVETGASRERGLVGYEIDASAPVPERLAHLYKDEGYDINGIVYKADTSSDEITWHYLMLYFAHHILGEVDPELDSLVKDTVKRTLGFIIDNGYILKDFTGKATTWAKWNTDYFRTEDGYVDACLNSAELLMYHLVTMDVTGEKGKWEESYRHLIDIGYADLTAKHNERHLQTSIVSDIEPAEDIMYGDHALALASFWGLCMLEKDESLLALYRKGFESWRSSMKKEHNPAYDFPYILSVPDDCVDENEIKDWFYGFNLSRLASGVSTVGRHDIAVKELLGGYKQISHNLKPDECFIAKYDRDPLEYKDSDSSGNTCVESCYVYTFAYWTGRYFDLID